MKFTTWLAAFVLTAVVALVAGCGSDDDDNGNASAGNSTDAAFVNDMIPHHEGAVEMAEAAQDRAEHPELRRLADDIIVAQKREIETMRSIEDDLGDARSDGHMSGDEHMRGMGSDMPMLREADEFDRAFIDMMIPHHEGAIRMAREELADGENPTLRGLAEDIIAAQRREIEQMRKWRAAWYGDDGSMHGGGSMMNRDDSMHE